MRWLAFISLCFGASAQLVQTPLTTNADPAVARAWLQIPAQPTAVTNVEIISTPFDLLSEYNSLRFQSRLQLDRLMAGKMDTNQSWVYWTGSNVNAQCWASLDLSGMSIGGGLSVAMVTRRHGITCHHAHPEPGDFRVFMGTNGLLSTNWVSAYSGSSNDLGVVTFSNECDLAVTPFSILPTNFPNWFPSGDWGITNSSYPWELIWFRPNTGKLNVIAPYEPSPWLQGAYRSPLQNDPFGNPQPELKWPSPPPFLDLQGGTGGDSGSPVFAIANGRPCLFYCTFFGAPSGPVVSWQPHFEFIQAVCGTNYPLSTLNLNRYTTYP